jgi:hypothetical protein
MSYNGLLLTPFVTFSKILRKDILLLQKEKTTLHTIQ